MFHFLQARCAVRRAVLLMALAAGLAAHAQMPAAVVGAAPPEPPPALDLREQVVRIPVTVRDLYGREQTRPIPITVFRPGGDGPFPLVVINHGRSAGELRATQVRARYEHLSRYLVQHGYVVMVPTRVGYAETYGDFDPEDAGSCEHPQLEPMSRASSTQILATVDYARTLPHVDARQWMVVGQSVGGLAAVATVARAPEGLLAGINFAGGRGGNPKTRPGDPCSPQALSALWSRYAITAQAPMLWLYWRNDQYWGERHPQRWHEAWVRNGGRAEFHQFAPVGEDGHSGLTADMDQWVPVFEQFTQKLGLRFGTWPAKPEPVKDASVEDLSRVPVSASAKAAGYEKFLQARTPRAFAISPSGGWAWATGDWAIGRALGNCQARRGEACKLYAVDNAVVWKP